MKQFAQLITTISEEEFSKLKYRDTIPLTCRIGNKLEIS